MLPDTTELDAVVTKNFLRSLAIAALACTGATSVHAQAVLELSYPANAPGAVPCIYTTTPQGISADPLTGHLLATGDFATTGCGSSLPLPVIVGGPSTWQLPNPWAVNTPASVQWAAANAASCTYGGSSATGWPSSGNACGTAAACETLHNVSLIPTSAGQYQFSLTCTNASGSVSSTSNSVAVSANPPVITQGPSTWNVLPWESSQSRTVQWSATNAANCGFTATTLPTGVTLPQFLSGGTSSCSSQGTCASLNSLILNAPLAGTYAVTLTCNGVGGGSTTNSQSWNVTQNSAGSCLQPAPGWNRLLTTEIYGFGGNYGFQDATQFDSIWGRNYGAQGFPIAKQWPGVGNQLVGPKIGNQQFIAAKFRTPATGQYGNNFTVDVTSFGMAGGNGNNSTAKVSITYSTACGDFDLNSVKIPPHCSKSLIGGNQTMGAYVNFGTGAHCSLQPNTDYYLNMIYAPLTSPASAVFNGVGTPPPLLQNAVSQPQP